jgi:hypothetical protein
MSFTGDTFCMNGKISLYPHTSQQGKPWMLLVMPKLPYFEITGQTVLLSNFANQALERGLANEKISRLLVLSNLTKLCCGECKIHS